MPRIVLALVAVAVLVAVLLRSMRDPVAPEPLSALSVAQPVAAPEVTLDLSAPAEDRGPATPRAPAAEEPAPVPPAELAAEYAVRGRVVDAQSRALAGVEVRLTTLVVRGPDAATKGVGGPKQPFALATSDGEGSFRFSIAPPAAGEPLRIRTDVAQPGFFAPERWDDFQRGVRVLELGDLVLRASTTLRGWVRDTQAAPVEGASVQVSVPTGPTSWGGVGTDAQTAADGSFEIQGGPSGRVSLVASSVDEGRGDPREIALEPGETREGIELVVPVRDDALAVSGVVLDVAGAPLANALVETSHRGPRGGGGGGRRTDAAGRFRVLGAAGSVFQLSVVQPGGGAAAAHARDVPIGTHDLVLRLAPLAAATLRVESSAGGPIERFAYRVRIEAQGHARAGAAGKLGEHAGGAVEFHLPPERFFLEVQAPGFARDELGPFDPGARPAVIVAVLDPLPALRGRVVRADLPVAGALVRAQAALERGRSSERDGFDLVAEPCERCATTKTAPDGTFALDVGDAGAWFVRAESAGDVSALWGPLEVGPRADAAQVEIDLAPRGAIEGRARTTSGRVLASLRVSASNGDGEPRTSITDSDGGYRFERLAPGEWQVRRLAQETGRGSSRRDTHTRGEAAPIAWDCRVEAGRTTRHDLVEPEPVEFFVRIHDASGRFPPGAWSVQASPADPRSKLARASADAPDAEGRFRLALESGGEWQVTARISAQSPRVQLDRVVHADGTPRETVFALGRGGVHGRLAAGSGPGEQIVLMGTTRDGVQVFASALGRADGTFEFPFGLEGEFELELGRRDGTRRVPVRLSADAAVDAGEL